MKIFQSSLIIGLVFLPALLFGYEIHYTDHIQYSAPTWTPDGKIAFIKSVSNSRKYVYGEEDKDVSGIFMLWHQTESISADTYLCTMNIDGTEKKEIMKFPSKFSPGYISWGKESVVVSEGFNPAKIATVRPNGRKFKVISEGSQGSISPNGKRIVYVGIEKIDNLHYKNTGIWLMDTDGKNKVQLTDNPGDTHPLWSPDSKMLAFERNVEGKGKEIWVMRNEGTGEKKVYEGDSRERLIDVIPNIDKVILFSMAGGKYFIYDFETKHKIEVKLQSGKDKIFSRENIFPISGARRFEISREEKLYSLYYYFTLHDGTIEYGKRNRRQKYNIWTE